MALCKHAPSSGQDDLVQRWPRANVPENILVECRTRRKTGDCVPMNFDAYQGRAAALYSLVSADLVDARRGMKPGASAAACESPQSKNVGGVIDPSVHKAPLILRSSIIARTRPCLEVWEPLRQTVLIVDEGADEDSHRHDRAGELEDTPSRYAHGPKRLFDEPPGKRRQHDCR